jgi:protein SCO1/2
MSRAAFQVGALLLATLALSSGAAAQLNRPLKELSGVEVSERLGEKAALGAWFTDSDGKRAELSRYFHDGKPVVLVLGYYTCPVVCPLVLDRLLSGLNGVDYTVGTDFNVVVVSFDPRNTTAMAKGYKDTYLSGYKRGRTAGVDGGWTFHTSTDEQARALASSVGFGYRFLEESGEYAHPVVLTVLTPTGVVSRYIYGFDYTARDLKLALLESSEGKIAKGLGDRILLFCYHYDPSRGGYSLAAFRVMQVGAGLTAVLLGSLVGGMWMFERRLRGRAAKRTAAPVVSGLSSAGVALSGPKA